MANHNPYMNSARWLITPAQKRRPAARLVCFPYAGAGASAFRGWADAAPDALEVCLVQLPGRENRLREAALTSVADVVAGLASELEPFCDLPFAFFGHSMGAIVAFETVRQLRRSGTRLPDAMFVSASRAPQLPWPHPPVRSLDDLSLLGVLNQRYDSVPAVVLQDPELRELLTPAVRADMTVVETYVYNSEAPFDFPLVAFGGDDDRMVGRSELEQWNAQTTGSFRLRMLAGNHLFLQPRRADLLAEIAEAMSVHGGEVAEFVGR